MMEVTVVVKVGFLSVEAVKARLPSTIIISKMPAAIVGKAEIIVVKATACFMVKNFAISNYFMPITIVSNINCYYLYCYLL